MELLFTPRGSRVIDDGVHIGSTRVRYIDYVFAVRPEARLDRRGRVSAYLLLGAGVDRLLDGAVRDSLGRDTDVTKGLRERDVALLLGAGGALHLARGGGGWVGLDAVMLEVRHDHGLMDVNLTGGFKNRNTSALIGVSFRLGAGPSMPAAAQ